MIVEMLGAVPAGTENSRADTAFVLYLAVFNRRRLYPNGMLRGGLILVFLSFGDNLVMRRRGGGEVSVTIFAVAGNLGRGCSFSTVCLLVRVGTTVFNGLCGLSIVFFPPGRALCSSKTWLHL